MTKLTVYGRRPSHSHPAGTGRRPWARRAATVLPTLVATVLMPWAVGDASAAPSDGPPVGVDVS